MGAGMVRILELGAAARRLQPEVDVCELEPSVPGEFHHFYLEMNAATLPRHTRRQRLNRDNASFQCRVHI